jgi:hypothetical protein
MANDITDVLEAFADAAGDVTGVASAFDHHPEALGLLPCVTLLILSAPQEIVETGPASDVTWTVAVNIYIDLLPDWATAHATLWGTVVPGLLAITVTDYGLDGTCSHAEVSDRGDEPIFNRDGGYLFKRLQLTVLTNTLDD